MATNPNGPSLNDLMYGSYNPDGSVRTSVTVPTLMIGQVFGPGSTLSDNTAIIESVSVNLPGLSFTTQVEDFTSLSEAISLAIVNTNAPTPTIQVSDSTVTSELVTRG